jgi:hypothetical protein
LNNVLARLQPSKRQPLKDFPALPNTGFPLVNYLHDEALGCLSHGFDHAAIVSASVLLEVSLKLVVAIHQVYSGEAVEKTFASWNQRGLNEAIVELANAKIISNEITEQLQTYRRRFRNVFSHGNTPIGSVKYHRDEQDDRMAADLAACIVGYPMKLMAETRSISLECFEYVDDVVRRQISWSELRQRLPTIAIELGPRRRFAFGDNPSPSVLCRGRSVWGRVRYDED